MRSVLAKGFVALAVLAAAALGYAWLAGNGEAQPRYRTAKVERGSIRAVVAASGTLNAVTTVQVGSQVSGQIKEILADFNSPVKKDQVIARIDPSSFELRVSQARADLEAARSAVAVQRSALAAQQAERARLKVNLLDAERDYRRKKALVEKNFISPAERDKAKTLYDASREQLRAAQAQSKVNEAQIDAALAAVKQREALLNQAQVDLEKTIIRAPVDGTVILRNVDAGQTVAASLQAPVLFTIAQDLHDMQVEAAIDEADVGRLRVGQRATFTVDAFPRRSFAGEIRQIRKSPQNVQNVISYTVVISAVNPDLALLPGMTANVRVEVDRRDEVLTVANAALRFQPPDAAPAAPESPPQSAPQAAGAPSGAARGGGQALLRARQRLDAALQPDATQHAKLDSLFEDARGQFAALSDLGSAAERRRRAAQIRAELRARVMEILRPAQREIYERLIAEAGARRAAVAGRLWLLADGAPKPVAVRIGLSDGTSTEIVSGELREGMEVIVGTTQGAARSGGAFSRMRLF
ncbi:MAG: efflux RND transporter periplasmic adaptor subunit [bacterium]|jgi:HlyD family secretion protein